MTQFECEDCGQLQRLPPRDGTSFRMQCPACGEETTWRRAFEGEGVSF
jgi:Zn finger protein HypA/HybF involved in hydrogenase expression